MVRTGASSWRGLTWILISCFCPFVLAANVLSLVSASHYQLMPA